MTILKNITDATSPEYIAACLREVIDTKLPVHAWVPARRRWYWCELLEPRLGWSDGARFKLVTLKAKRDVVTFRPEEVQGHGFMTLENGREIATLWLKGGVL